MKIYRYYKSLFFVSLVTFCIIFIGCEFGSEKLNRKKQVSESKQPIPNDQQTQDNKATTTPKLVPTPTSTPKPINTPTNVTPTPLQEKKEEIKETVITEKQLLKRASDLQEEIDTLSTTILDNCVKTSRFAACKIYTISNLYEANDSNLLSALRKTFDSTQKFVSFSMSCSSYRRGHMYITTALPKRLMEEYGDQNTKLFECSESSGTYSLYLTRDFDCPPLDNATRVPNSKQAKAYIARDLAEYTIRALKKLKAYEGSPSVLEDCQAKIQSINFRLKNADSANIIFSSGELLKIQEELGQIEDGIKRIEDKYEQFTVTVSKNEIDQVLSLCSPETDKTDSK